MLICTSDSSAEADRGLPKECQEKEENGQDWQHIHDGGKDYKFLWQPRMCSFRPCECSPCGGQSWSHILSTSKCLWASCSWTQECALQGPERETQHRDDEQLRTGAVASHGSGGARFKAARGSLSFTT
eukprot:TRINITY_DN835_c0_g1_i2.p2 TRINITY_DN835_c0_g1~~TRINITY_DN835_c0_g1_i2.p2  ORF type:complete len:128 (-),score=30.79 TRINITY_DN835_c0_g1_i2:2-385(-)